MNGRTLGIVAMICTPALMVEVIISGGEYRPLNIGIASMVFMAGWICSNTGMRRLRAAGTGKWGRAALRIQLIGLVLAFLFRLVEATGLLGTESLAFRALDLSWPLSMLWMIVVGVTVIAAKRLVGWRRFVPILCVPVWLAGMTLGAFALPEPVGITAGQGVGAAMWVLLGFVVRDGGEQVEGRAGATPEPAMR